MNFVTKKKFGSLNEKNFVIQKINRSFTPYNAKRLSEKKSMMYRTFTSCKHRDKNENKNEGFK